MRDFLFLLFQRKKRWKISDRQFSHLVCYSLELRRWAMSWNHWHPVHSLSTWLEKYPIFRFLGYAWVPLWHLLYRAAVQPLLYYRILHPRQDRTAWPVSSDWPVPFRFCWETISVQRLPQCWLLSDSRKMPEERRLPIVYLIFREQFYSCFL